MPSGRTHSSSTLDEVAASCLRASADTLTARVARDLPRGTGWLEELALRIGIPPLVVEQDIRRARASAAAALDRAAQKGQVAVTSLDPRYPAPLREIADPPLVLWCQGDVSLLADSAVAVVGARNAAPESLCLARQLGRDLAAAGLVVVSGMARGVDGAAHEGALERGKTVAVLGCGVDVTYPREHASLKERIVGTGVVVSELGPGTPSFPCHFPLRNRIISGLCRAVVVIEAGDKSGSLITARMALEQNRDVLAVPGNPSSGRYVGSHRLIKDGARLVETVKDVLDEIRWPRPQSGSLAFGAKPRDLSSLEAELTVGAPCSVDELAARTGRAASDLLAELSVLELAGRVLRVGGGGFVRVD